MGYSIRISNNPERITLFDLTHMINMTDPVTIGLETKRIDNGCSLDKEFTELIHLTVVYVVF